MGHRKLLYLEKIFAVLLVAGPPELGQLAGHLAGNSGPSVDEKMMGYRDALLGLQGLLEF